MCCTDAYLRWGQSVFRQCQTVESRECLDADSPRAPREYRQLQLSGNARHPSPDLHIGLILDAAPVRWPKHRRAAGVARGCTTCGGVRDAVVADLALSIAAHSRQRCGERAAGQGVLACMPRQRIPCRRRARVLQRACAFAPCSESGLARSEWAQRAPRIAALRTGIVAAEG